MSLLDAAPRDERVVGRLTVNQWVVLAATLLASVTAVGLILAVVALSRLADARDVVVNKVDPAVTAALRFSSALVNQETGVHAYALTARRESLDPYRAGVREEQRALVGLRSLGGVEEAGQVRTDTARAELLAARWRRVYAEPTIARVGRRGPGTDVRAMEGNRLFGEIRTTLRRQQDRLTALRAEVKERHMSAVRFLYGTFVAIAALIFIAIAASATALRLLVSRPLRHVARQARRVARGEYALGVAVEGPRDIAQLGADVDRMRRRIVEELASVREAHDRLDDQARDLQRSNAELEQFAYVASHDLQEPLRKVASFCQLLEKRYKGQLDERADQYIAFAVDGAKRMQQLINDLLAFSRVGRHALDQSVIDCDDVLRQALTSLAAAIEETDAEIVAGPLPSVCGEGSLLAGVFQNLIGNALKFHGEGRPRVEVWAERDGDQWVFACRDNGIGIEPDYAERIFMIFQRLHPKDVYAGTGIGLAMCRKIVEYHGGRIWLDTESTDGTTFRFTLPAIEETDTA